MDAAGPAILPKSPAFPGPLFLPGSLSSGSRVPLHRPGLGLLSWPRWWVAMTCGSLSVSAPGPICSLRPHSRLSWATAFGPQCPLAVSFQTSCCSLLGSRPPGAPLLKHRACPLCLVGDTGEYVWLTRARNGRHGCPALPPIQGTSRTGLADCCLICHQFNYLTSLVTSTRLRFALRSQQMCRPNRARGRHEGFHVYKASVFGTCDGASFLRGCCSFQNGAVQTLLCTTCREQLFTLLTVAVEK